MQVRCNRCHGIGKYNQDRIIPGCCGTFEKVTVVVFCKACKGTGKLSLGDETPSEGSINVKVKKNLTT